MAGMSVHVKTTGAVAVALFAALLAGGPANVGWARYAETREEDA